MTLSERRNYRIAVLASILFHGALLFYLSYGLLSGGDTADLEIYSAGLVAITPETRSVPVAQVKPAPPVRPQVVKPQTTGTNQVKTGIPVKAQPAVKAPEVRPQPKPQPRKEVEPQPAAKPKTDEQSKPEAEPQPAAQPAVDTATADRDAQPRPGEPESTNPTASEGNRSLGDGSGLVSRRGLVVSNRPTYPKDAENVGIEGDVSLRIMVLPDGSLEEPRILQSSGDKRLDQAAINFVKQEWAFKPNPEPYYIDVVFVFKMHVPVSYRFLNSQTRP